MTAEPSTRSWQMLTSRLDDCWRAEAFDSGRPQPPARSRRSTRWWAAVGAVAAAVIALAVLVPVLLPGGSHGGASRAAAAMLDRVAAIAGRQAPPATGGKYLFLETREASAGAIGPVGHEVAHLSSFTRYVWVAADGSGREVLVPNPLDPNPIAGIDHALPPGSSFDSTRYIGTLPTNPRLLERVIVERFEGGRADAAATLQFAGTFLQADASPALRQALYLMVKQLPGVDAVGNATDEQGRHGEAVTMGLSDGAIQLLFDPTTSKVLELRQFDTHGDLVHYVLYERAEHTPTTTTPTIRTQPRG